ncbi:MAG TPA: hypothetical protein VJ767_03410, partial [Nitrososphaeraceae archaeon]|nr:hypothetical protein [Nitrososphaeraceae archaeon]
MLANKDSSSKKKDTKRDNLFSLFYVSLFGFIFLSGTMLSIPSSFQTQPISLGSQDVYAQQYYPPPQKGYDDKSYGGDSYYSNSYDSNRYDSSSSYNSYDDDSYDKKKNIAQIEKEDNKLFI